MRIVDCALQLATYGLPVFPVHGVRDGRCTCGKPQCEHAGKHPRFHRDDLTSGHKSATTDETLIRKWWKRWPDANVGVSLGPDLVVVDLDPRYGGYESWNRLMGQLHDEIPVTATVKTGGGGEHLWFRNRGEPILCGSNAFGDEFPGIDVKSGGGYVVAPESLHASGERYRWMGEGFGDERVSDFPEELRTLLLRAKAARECGKARGVSQGQRNDHLFKLASSLRGLNVEFHEAIRRCLESAASCDPPFPEKETLAIVKRVYETYPGGPTAQGQDEEKDRRTKSKKALEVCEEVDLFHTPELKAYARFQQNGHFEVSGIRQVRFLNWLKKGYYQKHGEALGATPLEDTLGVLEAKATYEGPCEAVHIRIAHLNGKIYFDLGDSAWTSVEIDANGWRIVQDSPVRFVRPNGFLSMPRPEVGGSIEDLMAFVNPDSDEDFVLIVAFVIAAFMDPGHSSFPVLVLQGEKGTAKSTTARVLTRLVDPRRADLRRIGKIEDLAVSASKARILALDNVARLAPAISDLLCQFATGGALAKRELFTDEDEVVLEAKLPLILTGIEDIVAASDLADRSLFPRLRKISEVERKQEREFWGAFERTWPRLLGWVLDAVSAALRNWETTKPAASPRMADFFRWVLSAEETFGRYLGTFERAYRASRSEANQSAFESSALAMAVKSLLDANFGESGEGVIDETPTDLRAQLLEKLPEAEQKRFPDRSRLRGELRKVASVLREFGIEIENAERTANRRSLRITKSAHPVVMGVTGVTAEPNSVPGNDGSGQPNDDQRSAEVGTRHVEQIPHDDDDGHDACWEDLPLPEEEDECLVLD